MCTDRKPCTFINEQIIIRTANLKQGSLSPAIYIECRLFVLLYATKVLFFATTSVLKAFLISGNGRQMELAEGDFYIALLLRRQLFKKLCD